MVPSGPAYPKISPQNQVCPVTGSTAGSNVVSGDQYIEQSFGYTHTHLWRNYGILIAYFIALLMLYGLVVEFVPQVEKGRGDVLIFLRRNRHATKTEKTNTVQQNDKLEKAPNTIKKLDSLSPKVFHSSSEKLKQNDGCFTWKNLEYQIPVKGGTKTLLTDIHGYVKSGTMTGKLHPHMFISKEFN